MSHHDDVERDLDLLESHTTDPLTAFETDIPGEPDAPSPVRRTLETYAPAAALFLVVLAVWEATTRLFDVETFILPKPTEIVARLAENSGDILTAARHTAIESLGGLAAGTLLGVLVALATVRWVRAREGLMPFAIAANSVPIIALAPITNAWFSITSPVSKMAVVAVVVFFPVMINTARGLTEVDPAALELMRSYAASPREVLQRVRIPSALPYFFSAMKVATALSIIAAIVAEYFGGANDVLGRYILQKASLLVFDTAWAAILVASLLGIALYGLVVLAEHLLMPWHVSFRRTEGT